MRTIYYVAASLDGYIADNDGGVAWLDPFDHYYGYEDFIAGIDTVVMGRTTYDQVLTFGIDYPYADKRSIILTSRPLTDPPPNVTAHSGSLQELYADLQRSAENVWVVGGGNIAAQFLKDGMLHEIEMYLIPVLLGGGIPLFGDHELRKHLNFETKKVFPNGVVQLRWTS